MEPTRTTQLPKQSRNYNRLGFAITGLVLGIVSVVLFMILVFTASAATNTELNDTVEIRNLSFYMVLIVSIVGLVFSSLSLKSVEGKNLAWAGFVLTVVPLGVIFLLYLISFIAMLVQ